MNDDSRTRYNRVHYHLRLVLPLIVDRPAMSNEHMKQLNDIDSWNDYETLLLKASQKKELKDDNHSNSTDVIFSHAYNCSSTTNRKDDTSSNQEVKDIIDNIILDAKNELKVQSQDISTGNSTTINNDNDQEIGLLVERISTCSSSSKGYQKSDHQSNDTHDDDEDNGEVIEISKNQDDDASKTQNGQNSLHIKYEWMRPNPALYFQLGCDEWMKKNDNTSTSTDDVDDINCSIENENNFDKKGQQRWNMSIASKASRMVNIYDKKKNSLLNHHQDKDVQKDQQSNQNDVKELGDLVQFPQMDVDLTRLLDPQLVSQWIPGSMFSSTFDIRRGVDTKGIRKTKKRLRNESMEGEAMTTYETIVDQICQNVFDLINKNKHTRPKDENNVSIRRFMEAIKEIRLDYHFTLIEKIKNVHKDDWMRILPSSLLIQTMKKRKILVDEDNDKMLPLRSILLVLLALVSIGHSKSLGRHVVQILCPSLLSMINVQEQNHENGVSQDGREKDDHNISDEEQRLMEYLATSLVQNCFGGNVSKAELHEMMQIHDQTNHAPSVWVGLKHEINVAFSNYHRS